MLRKYISKGSDISKYSAEDLDKIVSKLSDLERKKLNYYGSILLMGVQNDKKIEKEHKKKSIS